MPEISLTDFVDFVVKVGSPKQTKVRQLKNRSDYDPAADFWKKLRRAIIAYHEEGHDDKRVLNAVLDGLTDKKKINRYPEAIKGYKKFLGRKQIEWFTPPKKRWSASGLDVRVNPELGLIFKGKSYIVKLYFKDEKLTKQKVGVILAMMAEALGSRKKPADEIAILDVANNKFISNGWYVDSLSPLLNGEAASFVAMWDQL